jgi:hypothetical protein
MFSEPFAMNVRTTHSFFGWQKLKRESFAPGVFRASAAVARFFDDDFVHVWSHKCMCVCLLMDSMDKERNGNVLYH